MNPATPILITVVVVIPFLILAMYFHRYIHLARRPNVARLKVLRWALLAHIFLMVAFGAFQIICHIKLQRLHLFTAGLLVWPLLTALLIGIWRQIRHLQKLTRKPPYPGQPAPDVL